jgi:hydroxypyruvate reductase
VLEAAHPVPDEAGQRAADRVLELAGELGEGDLLLVLISGGGSALLPAFAEGISLADAKATFRALLGSGAAIQQLNCVRKHLSRINGGRLAAAATPAAVHALILSDVLGDDLSVIASGPTVPDATTCADALAVLRRYRIDLPQALIAALEAGTLELLDVSGRRVTRRQLGARGQGRYELVLGAGRRLQSGIYFIRLVQGDRIATRRVSVLE